MSNPPFRIIIVTKRGDKAFDIQMNEGINDDCLDHVATILASFAVRTINEPKLIFDLDAGEFSIAVSTCSSYYFVSIVYAKERETIKSLNRLVSIFLGLAVATHEEEFGPLPKIEDYLDIKETLYQDLDEAMSTIFLPEETEYFCFIVGQNIIYFKGKVPYSGEDYFEALTDLTDLAEVCLFEPFGALENRKDIIVFPYFKHLQVGYINNHENELDPDFNLIEKYKTRITISKYTIPQRFLIIEPDEEEEEIKH